MTKSSLRGALLTLTLSLVLLAYGPLPASAESYGDGTCTIWGDQPYMETSPIFVGHAEISCSSNVSNFVHVAVQMQFLDGGFRFDAGQPGHAVAADGTASTKYLNEGGQPARLDCVPNVPVRLYIVTHAVGFSEGTGQVYPITSTANFANCDLDFILHGL